MSNAIAADIDDSGPWRIVLRLTAGLVLCLLSASGIAQSASRCSELAHIKIPNASIVLAQSDADGSPQPPTGKKLTGLPAFCRVAIVSKPASDSNIQIEIWLPENEWNGRLLGTGNGGGAGAISFGSLASGLRRHFAVANTDLGTSPNAAAVTGHPDRWSDFGFRATHEMTVIAKTIVRDYYGSSPKRSYFSGCSTGGQQALSEAQRYPKDYDGIIAGAPAGNRTHLHTDFLWNYQATHHERGALIPPDVVALLTRSVLAACVGKDGGAPDDHFLTDPRACAFNLESLRKCSSAGEADCITPTQLEALKKIYAGPTNPVTGELIHAPLPFGTESSSLGLTYQESEAVAKEQFYPFLWAFGTKWDPMSFDFAGDESRLDEKLSSLLNANDPDLSAFRKHGGRLIMYTGTADPIVPFPDAIEYYEHVISAMQHDDVSTDSSKALKKTQTFFRYYLVPGMGHCGGGPGLVAFGQGISSNNDDLLFKLQQWVEKGTVPDPILAKGKEPADGADMERYLCAYPKFPTYIGGKSTSATSFRCTARRRGDIPNSMGFVSR